MADYIKREDAVIKAKQAVFAAFRYGKTPAENAVYENIDIAFKEQYLPSADVVEVVRCKDCSHAHKTSFPSELRICLTTGCFHSENHFCSDGKRMDGGT